MRYFIYIESLQKKLIKIKQAYHSLRVHIFFCFYKRERERERERDEKNNHIIFNQ